MAPMRTVIVDDEPLALDLLETMISASEHVDLVGRCLGGAEAVCIARELRPDLMFLDVEMPEVTGFEVLAQLGGDETPMAIFATAHARFALQAFDARAVDYLLKPLDPQRVDQAVRRAADQRLIERGDANRRSGGGALISVADRSDASAIVPVRDGGRTHLVRLEDVVWAEAAGDYTLIHTASMSHAARMTIRSLESVLTPPDFLRVHRSALVSTCKVREVIHQPKGEAILIMQGDAEVKVSRTHRKALELIIGYDR